MAYKGKFDRSQKQNNEAQNQIDESKELIVEPQDEFEEQHQIDDACNDIDETQDQIEKPHAKKKRRNLLPLWIFVLIIGICGFINSFERREYPVENAQTDPTVETVEMSTTAPIETEEPTIAPTTEPLETEPVTEPTAEETEPEETVPEETKPAPVVYNATVGAMGNLVMHKPIFNVSTYGSIVQQPDGSYNFESVFKYIKDNISEFDYAAVNLETTLAGTGNGYQYGGYPNFNCPDEIVVGLKDAGFDMLLTANDHSSDTGMIGFNRTLEVIRKEGLTSLGTYQSVDEKNWVVNDLNGVNVGMICYTWASGETSDGRPTLNGNTHVAQSGLCNYFYSKNLDAFYKEVGVYIAEMEAAGADATMMFIHWGGQYQSEPTKEQKEIAQKLCDMGIDVIVGSHPYIIQPIELIQSSVDPNHKTFCIYSTGNALSNYRSGSLDNIKTAHTEDGIMFYVVFEKVDDGDAEVSYVNVLPTWVNMRIDANGRREYNIIPLDVNEEDRWQDTFGLSDEELKKAKDSHKRTMDIVGEGLQSAHEYLIQQAHTWQ